MIEETKETKIIIEIKEIFQKETTVSSKVNKSVR